MSKQPNRLGSFESYGQFGQPGMMDAELPQFTQPDFQSGGAAAGAVMTGISSILGAIGTTGAQIYAAKEAAKLEKARLKAQGSSAAPAFDPSAMMAMMAQQQQSSAMSPGVIIALVLVVLIMFGGMMYIATKSSSKRKSRKLNRK